MLRKIGVLLTVVLACVAASSIFGVSVAQAGNCNDVRSIGAPYDNGTQTIYNNNWSVGGCGGGTGYGAAVHEHLQFESGGVWQNAAGCSSGAGGSDCSKVFPPNGQCLGGNESGGFCRNTSTSVFTILARPDTDYDPNVNVNCLNWRFHYDIQFSDGSATQQFVSGELHKTENC